MRELEQPKIAGGGSFACALKQSENIVCALIEAGKTACLFRD